MAAGAAAGDPLPLHHSLTHVHTYTHPITHALTHSGLKEDHPKQTEAATEPIYRKVESVESSALLEQDGIVRLRTAVVSVHHLLEKSSISIDVRPSSHAKEELRQKQRQTRKVQHEQEQDRRRLQDPKDFTVSCLTT